MTAFLHVVAFHTSFPVYVGGILAGLILLAALYVRSLVKVLVRLRNSAFIGAGVAAALVLYVGAFRHAALVKAAAEWGRGGPDALLAFGGGDIFVIVTIAAFGFLMFRKKARKAAVAARSGNGPQRRPVRAGGRA